MSTALLSRIISSVLLLACLPVWVNAQAQFPAETEYRLVTLNQSQQDLMLVIPSPGSAPLTLGNALGRSGDERVLLLPQQTVPQVISNTGASVSTTLDSSHIQPVSHYPEIVLELLKTSNDASALWSSQDISKQQQALQVWHQASQLALPPEYAELSHYALLNALVAAVTLYDYSLAATLLERWYQQVGEAHPQHYKALWQHGQLLSRQRDLEGAEAKLLAALTQIDPSYRYDKAEIEGSLSVIYLRTNRIPQAEALLLKAKSAVTDNPLLTALVLDNMGFLNVQKGKAAQQPQRDQFFQAAIEHELAAIALLRTENATTHIATIQSNVASIYERLGNLTLAQHYYQQALDNTVVSRHAFNAAVISRNLGKISQYLGDVKKSMVFYQNAARHFAPSSPLHTARMHCELGISQRMAGLLDEAIQSHQLCAEYFATEQPNDDYSIAQTQLAIDYLHKGNIAQARYHAEQTAPLQERPDNLDRQVHKLLLDMQLAAHQGNTQAIETAFQQAVEKASRSRYPATLVEVYQTATKAAMTAGDLPMAVDSVEAGLRLALHMHEHLEPQHFGPAWSQKTRFLFDAKLHLLLNTSQYQGKVDLLEASFQLLEKYRAVSLSVHQQRDIRAQGSSPQSLDLDSLAHLADTRAASRKLDEWQDYLAFEQQKMLAVSFQRQQNRGVGRYNLTALQRALSPDQGVFYFAETQDQLYLLEIGSEIAKWHNVAELDAISPLIADSRSILSDPNNQDLNTLKQLAVLLIPDEVANADLPHWFIVPSASVSELSFSALMPGLREAGTTMPSITYLPAANALLKPASAPTPVQQVAILANPVFSSVGEPQRDSWSATLAPLPFSHSEAQVVSTQMATHHVTQFTGREANRRVLFSEQVRNASVLHLATHGFYSAAQPDNPGLALSAVDEADQPINGFVSLSELYRYPFNNHLVVISGCETNRGEVAGKEGVLGLSRAFLAQGSDNVISTLWPVSDSASVHFMGMFYQHYQQLGSIAGALVAAQSQMARHPRFRHPFYWAAYSHHSVAQGQ